MIVMIGQDSGARTQEDGRMIRDDMGRPPKTTTAGTLADS